MSQRKAAEERKTRETDIIVSLKVDGAGKFAGDTGVGFLNHMLELTARHGLFDLEVRASGDLEVDYHHTVEDVGICLGIALKKSLGDKKGIRRFGDSAVPMEDAMARVAIDLGGRAGLVFKAEFPCEKIGVFDTELVREFLQAFSANAGMNIHVEVPWGDNAHHIAEAIFKALARALDDATRIDERRSDVPSTKGVI